MERPGATMARRPGQTHDGEGTSIMPRSKRSRVTNKAARGKAQNRSHKKGRSAKPKTRDEWLAWIKRERKQFHERAFQEERAWLSRPRLHTAIFAEAWENEKLAREAEKRGARIALSEAQERRDQEGHER